MSSFAAVTLVAQGTALFAVRDARLRRAVGIAGAGVSCGAGLRFDGDAGAQGRVLGERRADLDPAAVAEVQHTDKMCVYV